MRQTSYDWQETVDDALDDAAELCLALAVLDGSTAPALQAPRLAAAEQGPGAPGADGKEGTSTLQAPWSYAGVEAPREAASDGGSAGSSAAGTEETSFRFNGADHGGDAADAQHVIHEQEAPVLQQQQQQPLDTKSDSLIAARRALLVRRVTPACECGDPKGISKWCSMLLCAACCRGRNPGPCYAHNRVPFATAGAPPGTSPADVAAEGQMPIPASEATRGEDQGERRGTKRVWAEQEGEAGDAAAAGGKACAPLSMAREETLRLLEERRAIVAKCIIPRCLCGNSNSCFRCNMLLCRACCLVSNPTYCHWHARKRTGRKRGAAAPGPADEAVLEQERVGTAKRAKLAKAKICGRCCALRNLGPCWVHKRVVQELPSAGPQAAAEPPVSIGAGPAAAPTAVAQEAGGAVQPGVPPVDSARPGAGVRTATEGTEPAEMMVGSRAVRKCTCCRKEEFSRKCSFGLCGRCCCRQKLGQCRKHTDRKSRSAGPQPTADGLDAADAGPSVVPASAGQEAGGQEQQDIPPVSAARPAGETTAPGQGAKPAKGKVGLRPVVYCECGLHNTHGKCAFGLCRTCCTLRNVGPCRAHKRTAQELPSAGPQTTADVPQPNGAEPAAADLTAAHKSGEEPVGAARLGVEASAAGEAMESAEVKAGPPADLHCECRSNAFHKKCSFSLCKRCCDRRNMGPCPAHKRAAPQLPSVGPQPAAEASVHAAAGTSAVAATVAQEVGGELQRPVESARLGVVTSTAKKEAMVPAPRPRGAVPQMPTGEVPNGGRGGGGGGIDLICACGKLANRKCSMLSCGYCCPARNTGPCTKHKVGKPVPMPGADARARDGGDGGSQRPAVTAFSAGKAPGEAGACSKRYMSQGRGSVQGSPEEQGAPSKRARLHG